ncbi:MAG: hypothetical protein KKB37_05090 [Alphaproteobacteria bacterium]|nr:hypothetical protein [Alphaproteobacteria bacterium]
MEDPHFLSPALEQKLVAWVQQWYPWHQAIFIGFNGLLTALNVWTGKPWWALWPLVITGGVFTLHYLIYKTSMIDDAWVEERAGDLYDRSYDQGHIESIAGRHDLETPLQRTERELLERKARREQARAAARRVKTGGKP